MRAALIWSRFGPYHLARLRAARDYFAEQGGNVVGVEIAGEDLSYPWRDNGGVPRAARTLFPGAAYQELTKPAVASRLLAALRSLGPDAVAIHGYAEAETSAALNWCRANGRCAVLISDSKADDFPRSWWRERVKSLLVRRFDAALVAGSRHAEYIAGLGMPEERVFLGCDVVDNAHFRQGAGAARQPGFDRGAYGIPEGRFFLVVTRFLKRKNLLRLLGAYRRYLRHASGDVWDLVLAGDGPQKRRIERTVAEAGIRGVSLVGFQQIDVLPYWYGCASGFIHPALQDQWGLAVNEAMAAGLPVLVSERAGCAPELVEQGGNGWLFDPESVGQMADAMLRLHNLSPGERRAFGERSQEIIRSWSPARFARSLWQATNCGALGRGRIAEAAGSCLSALHLALSSR